MTSRDIVLSNTIFIELRRYFSSGSWSTHAGKGTYTYICLFPEHETTEQLICDIDVKDEITKIIVHEIIRYGSSPLAESAKNVISQTLINFLSAAHG